MKKRMLILILMSTSIATAFAQQVPGACPAMESAAVFTDRSAGDTNAHSAVRCAVTRAVRSTVVNTVYAKVNSTVQSIVTYEIRSNIANIIRSTVDNIIRSNVADDNECDALRRLARCGVRGKVIPALCRTATEKGESNRRAQNGFPSRLAESPVFPGLIAPR